MNLKNTVMAISYLAFSANPLLAQDRERAARGLPFVSELDAKVLRTQSNSFFKAMTPLAMEKGKHAVNVMFGRRQLVRGTVTEQGILTKWSEVNTYRANLSIVGYDGVRYPVVVDQVFKAHDLVLLRYSGKLPAVAIETPQPNLRLGSFLVAVVPTLEAQGLGVVSVAPRSLREQDKAFLGVHMDYRNVEGGGVLLRSIERGSAAAAAGLNAGDVVTKVNQKPVNGLLEMSNFLQQLSPGQVIPIEIRRRGKTLLVRAELKSRPQLRRIPQSRMNRMKTMGGPINKVSEGFPQVIQTDMQLSPTDVGAPVFDLDGKFIGIVAARASRIKTYIIPASQLSQIVSRQRTESQ